jgi:formylglycine-generating enzyme
LLDGLHGKADRDKNKRVSILELYEYASLETKTFVARNRNDFQTPALRGEIHGVLELGDVNEAKGQLTNSIGMKFKLIPPGEFWMGSSDTVADLQSVFPGIERGAYTRELPRHPVRITRPYYLGVFEVTRTQFAEFVRQSGYLTDAERDGQGGWGYDPTKAKDRYVLKAGFNWRYWGVNQSDSSPATNISWNDAQAFCQWLSDKESQRYRLPTEAEWEYACRAGTTGRYYSGNNPEDLVRVGNVGDANYKQYFPTFIALRSADGFAFTSPVGRFRPNAFGLYDMHGNTWEWCSDWFSDSYYANSPREDPTGAEIGVRRVIRGGGWGTLAAHSRSSSRFAYGPTYRDADAGFRVAREP